MAHLIDKDTLENILRRLWKEDDGKNSEYRIYYNKALQEVQCEIDSLEVKEVDLEEKVDDNQHTSICSEDIEWLANHFGE